MFVTEYKGILFIEGKYSKGEVIQTVNTAIKGFFESPQVRNLDDVKARLATLAEKLDANAIVEFQYGQKSATFWESLFSRDDVHWYGSGLAVRLSEKQYQDLLKQCR